MGFKLQFQGGPLDKQTEERRSAPDYIKMPDGMYNLDRISGTTAHMVWKDTSHAKVKKEARA